mmetsp:Transcript_68352/g.160237  ORF Transcript_68352/g.160237 Transcript_68352/m.160237 type:complete len:281 (-) Transcript_68352:268-1110(-)
MHLAAAVLLEVRWNLHPVQMRHVGLDLNAILAFLVVIQLLVDARCKLVEQTYEIRSPAVTKANVLQPRGEPGEFPDEVEIQGDGLQHCGALNFHRYLGSCRFAELSLVDLAQRSSRHRLWGDRDKHVLLLGRLTKLLGELAFQGGHCDLCGVRRHLVAELLQLDHRPRREEVRSDAQRLAQLDEERPQRRHNLIELGRLLHLDIGSRTTQELVPDNHADQGSTGTYNLQHSLQLHPGQSVEVLLQDFWVVGQRQPGVLVCGDVDQAHFQTFDLTIVVIQA